MNPIARDQTLHVRGARAGIALLVALAATCVLWGCGNDGTTDPIDVPIEDGQPRSTPEKLMDYFEKVYSQRDSVGYAAMLHPEYTFEFLTLDADSLRDVLGQDSFWGRALDLQSTGRLFTHPEVTSITLIIVVNTNTAYAGEDCDDCRQLETTITLRVSTVGDGTEPLIYAVNSPQTFVVRPDPSDASMWVIWRQIDRPSSFASAARSVSAGHV